MTNETEKRTNTGAKARRNAGTTGQRRGAKHAAAPAGVPAAGRKASAAAAKAGKKQGAKTNRDKAARGARAAGGKAPAKAPEALESRRSRREARMAKAGTPAEKAASAEHCRASRRAASAELGDDFAANPPRRRAKRAGGGHAAAYVAASVVLVACMAYIGYLIRQQEVAYAHFLEMKQVVENQTFYEGTTVEGVDVSSLTLRAALDYWRDSVEPGYADRSVTLDDGTTLTARDMGYVSDYESVLTNAWSAGRNGSLESRYRAAVSHRQNPAAYRVTRVLYDEDLIGDYVQGLADQIDRPAKDAAVKGFNVKKASFSFSDAERGQKLNAGALKADIGAALQAGGGSVTREIEEIAPKVTAGALKKQFGSIATATTNASSSSSNRLSNIRQALKLINGTCIEPGKTFSFNKTVGKRTTERGFKIATAYSAGDVTEEVGGGICQVSTTLFNAAVKADLKIVERHNHSLTVAYVDSGKDATVNWGSQDLRFTNNTGEKVYILCYLTNDKRVRIGIFGRLLANGEYITVDAQTTETIDFDTEYVPSDELEKGKQRLVSSGKPGCKAVAYKVRWSAKGKEISRELLCKSWYKAKNAVVAVGT